MTNDEALALKPGDRVFAVIGAGPYSDVGNLTSLRCRLRLMEVSYVQSVNGRVYWLRLRRVGYKANGAKYPVIERQPARVLTPAEYKEQFRTQPNITPQIYADWLEENGFPDAAAALRRKFPLVVED